MKENYAEVLEGYLIPAEEGFVGSIKDFFSNIDRDLAVALGVIGGTLTLISLPVIATAKNIYIN